MRVLSWVCSGRLGLRPRDRCFGTWKANCAIAPAGPISTFSTSTCLPAVPAYWRGGGTNLVEGLWKNPRRGRGRGFFHLALDNKQGGTNPGLSFPPQTCH